MPVMQWEFLAGLGHLFFRTGGHVSLRASSLSACRTAPVFVHNHGHRGLGQLPRCFYCRYLTGSLCSGVLQSSVGFGQPVTMYLHCSFVYKATAAKGKSITPQPLSPVLLVSHHISMDHSAVQKLLTLDIHTNTGERQ